MESKAMRQMKVPASFGPLFLSMFLLAALWVPLAATRAQTPSAATSSAAATTPSSSAQSATFFISCSTSGGAGIDTYYTGVFDIGAKPGPGPKSPYSLAASADGGITWMDRSEED